MKKTFHSISSPSLIPPTSSLCVDDAILNNIYLELHKFVKINEKDFNKTQQNFNEPYFQMNPYFQMMPRLPTGLEYELYVCDLDERIDEVILNTFLQGYGTIYSIKIMRYAQKHTSKRFGYVVFYNANDVKKIKKLFFSFKELQTHFAKRNNHIQYFENL